MFMWVCQNFSKNYLKPDYEVRKGKEKIGEIGVWEAGLSQWSLEVAGIRRKDRKWVDTKKWDRRGLNWFIHWTNNTKHLLC